jgi:predicted SprT family Zn-dependent metalloprotease
VATMYQYRCQCGRDASVYAVDRCAGGWGGYYCLTCKPAGWDITDYLSWGA